MALFLVFFRPSQNDLGVVDTPTTLVLGYQIINSFPSFRTFDQQRGEISLL